MPDSTTTPTLPRTTAFLIFHVPHCGDEVLPEMAFAHCAGELRAKGLSADVVHIGYDPFDPLRWRAIEDSLVAHLRGRAVGLAVFDQVPDPATLRRLRTELGLRFVCADPWGGRRDSPPDVLVHHASTNWVAFGRICSAAARGESLADLPNAELRRGDRYVSSSAGREPVCVATMATYLPRREHIVLPPDLPLDDARRALGASSGCPHSLPVRANPRFALTPPRAGQVEHGCSFCTVGQHYHAPDLATAADVLAQRIAAIRRTEPEVDTISLSDQMPLAYLPRLVDRLRDDGLLPLTLMLSTRADWIVGQRHLLEAATAAMAAAGGALGMYLCGLETFDEGLAGVYNKTARPQDWGAIGREAVHILYELRARHGEAFILDPGTASFIVFSPWTTLEGLRHDAEAMQELGLAALSAEAPFSALRLYDNVPLAEKARREGLLLNAPREAADMGYAEILPWRFADPRVATVHALVTRLRPMLEAPEGPGLLRAAVDLVDRVERGEADIPDSDELAAGLAALHRLLARAPDRPEGVRLIEVGSRCNNGCKECLGRQRQPGAQAIDRISEAVLDAGIDCQRVLIGGREPTLIAGLPRLIRDLRLGGVREIGVRTNGRRFADPAYARACVKSGLDRVLFKVAGPDAAVHDAFTRVPGSLAQLRAGIAGLRRASAGLRRPIALEAVLLVHAGHLPGLSRTVRWLEGLDIGQVRLCAPIGGLDLDSLGAAAATVESALGPRRMAPASPRSSRIVALDPSQRA